MNTTILHLSLFCIAHSAAFASFNDCNVIWDSPSRDSFDSMPLSGSHGAGANFWFQDGAFWFYPGHRGAQDDNSGMLKLGAIRVTPEGADLKSPKRFRQELDLPSGAIRVDAEAKDGTTLDARLWFAGGTLVVEVKFSRELSLLARQSRGATNGPRTSDAAGFSYTYTLLRAPRKTPPTDPRPGG